MFDTKLKRLDRWVRRRKRSKLFDWRRTGWRRHPPLTRIKYTNGWCYSRETEIIPHHVIRELGNLMKGVADG